MTKMDWQRARRRPAQRDDDRDDAAARWLAQHELQQADDGVQWSAWREFERNGLRGWERDGMRKRERT